MVPKIIRKILLISFTLAFFSFSFEAHAQIIQIPDCNLFPQHPFCQGECFGDPLPPWCDPPEPELDPIIIIPGITASLNLQRIFLDQDGGTWHFAPFAQNFYRGLIERLENVGYEQGTNLFIAHYDWRQSNNESATEYLKPVIDQAKSDTGATKVDIIAHSMGGLVARSYIQGNNYEDDVDQFITLGTPNFGASDAYVAWEGGEFPARWSIPLRTYIGLVEDTLKKMNNSQFLLRPESFRTFFPFLHDLLPTNEFATQDNQSVPLSELTEQNLFLSQLNNTVNDLTSNTELTTIAGNNLQTLNQISLTEDRSILDQIRNRWRDGHPQPDPPPADTNGGDQTVLLSSAHIGSQNITIDDAQHDKLPEAAQEEVLTALGLDSSGPHLAYDLPESMLGTVILSPIDPQITCDNGQVLDQNTNTFPEAEFISDGPSGPKLLVIANPPEAGCELILTGNDTGDFTAITTYADDDEVISTTTEGTGTGKGRGDDR